MSKLILATYTKRGVRSTASALYAVINQNRIISIDESEGLPYTMTYNSGIGTPYKVPEVFQLSAALSPLTSSSDVATMLTLTNAIVGGKAVNTPILFNSDQLVIATQTNESDAADGSTCVFEVTDGSGGVSTIEVRCDETLTELLAFNSPALPITGKAATGYGVLTLKTATAIKAFAGGATEVIPVAVPSGALLVGAQLRNDTILTATTGVSYSAAYSGGATQAISSGTAFTKNTKVSTFFNIQGTGEATAITSGTTNITLTPNAGTLDTGTVTAVVYYYEFTALTSVA